MVSFGDNFAWKVLKKYKNMVNLLSAEFAQRVVEVEYLVSTNTIRLPSSYCLRDRNKYVNN